MQDFFYPKGDVFFWIVVKKHQVDSLHSKFQSMQGFLVFIIYPIFCFVITLKGFTFFTILNNPTPEKLFNNQYISA